ncbi:DUF1264 domain-containing protein [Sinorhizobium meliloti]|uniref:DUF1264 domain-containing protein n=1 Tax=Rhizobium meliloti TaxID=382 RepID=UPI000B499238|nr:DUF1264 domain-containing protein [Sinorhizobium meliloti]MDX0986030.1 DUF1264 domain-containing protein [Sinorhizobium medicae]ASQ15090.1 DUF1264 domain-containing protein [Sinorhizobium meliloti]MDW9378439.1 DUF1264 domain-containing protein [Sinorhizobium meliloti]MDW9496675.1 DUF1264 domain-containing protein [Sinorhizobium meliloti]MDW9546678.1 DUF1264 domain-containing protein [Sinorhizobium meliloti]
MKVQSMLTVLFTSLLAAAAAAASTHTADSKPAARFTHHVDGNLHFPDNKDMIAHHYCKPVAGGMAQCLLFESDNADARLVGVEVILDPGASSTFTDSERPMWHYHTTEVPKVSPAELR